MTLRFSVLALLLAFAHSAPLAQEATTGALRVAYDCQTGGCDRDFFQTELPYVQFVRDQGDADVFVLINGESTGGGGTRYTLAFTGRKTYDGQTNTLTTSVPADATSDDSRRALLSRLRLGLTGYVARTPLAERLTIGYEAPEASGDADVPEVDPWNGWVFRLRGSTFFDGQSRSSSFSGNGNVSATRTTEAWKTRLSVFSSYNRSEFEISDDETFVSERSSQSASGFVARSLGDHLTAAFDAGLSRNTFFNYDALFTAGPAVEYSLFPYSESTQRLVTARYGVDLRAVAYVDTTIFGEISEVLPQHTLRLGVELAQPWGSVNASANAQQYLSQPSKYDAGLFGGINVRLARGLQLNLGGSVSYIRNQLNLPAGGLTPEEILTEQRELATNFRYFGNVGLTYSFGSIYNAVVNPRFSDGGSVFFF